MANVSQLILVLISIPFLWLSIRRFKLALTVEDVPLSNIGSAAQGYVEVKGKTFTHSDLKLYVPMLRIPCVWYRYEAFRDNQDYETAAPEVKESFQRIYIQDQTGVCAIEPAMVDIIPRKTEKLVEHDVVHRFTWLGVGEHVYVAGWLKTLHPAPKVNDKLPGYSKSLIKISDADRRYGQLKEPLNIIRKPPDDNLPFFVTTRFRYRTAQQARLESVLYGFIFAVVGVVLPIVVSEIYI